MPVTLICQKCGNPFSVDPSRASTARYCSRACQGLANRVPRIPCEECGEPMVPYADGRVRRFCSVPCRDARKRANVTCQRCGTVFTRKASEAANRLFCSRKCMFEAWGCAWCHLIVPDERRAAGDAYCSDRCALSARLDADAATGPRLAVCGTCQHIKPAGEFHIERTNRNGLSNRCKACSKAKYEATKPDYQRRRWQAQAAPGGVLIPFTAQQREARWAMWGGRCWVCGIADATEEDHTKPISAGGSHCLSNLRPICKPCNVRKRSRWPLTAPYDRANFQHPNPRPGSDAEQRTPRLPRVEWTCPQCQVTFTVRAHEARSRKYCSKTCHTAAQTLPRVTKTCPQCHRDFSVPGHRWAQHRKFCSTECFYNAHGAAARHRTPGPGQTVLW